VPRHNNVRLSVDSLQYVMFEGRCGVKLTTSTNSDDKSVDCGLFSVSRFSLVETYEFRDCSTKRLFSISPN